MFRKLPILFIFLSTLLFCYSSSAAETDITNKDALRKIEATQQVSAQNAKNSKHHVNDDKTSIKHPERIEPNKNNYKSYGLSILKILKDIAGIIFWITASFVSVLTYRKAKDTILQPIRTEVAKKQTDLFSDLLNKIDSSNGFDFFDILSLNMIYFVSHFANYKILINNEPFFKSTLAKQKSHRPIKHSQFTEEKYDSFIPSHAVGINNDGKVVLKEISLHNEHIELISYLNKVSNNPFTPSEIAIKINCILETYSKSIDEKMSVTLEKYYNVIFEQIKTGHTLGVLEISVLTMTANNDYNRQRLKHECQIAELRNEIKNYLKIEKLFS